MKYRKKPVVIEAFKWTGDYTQLEDPEWIRGQVRFIVINEGTLVVMEIETLEGVMRANPGDFIIKGVKGEIYPCKPDIFEMTYEPAE